MAGGDRGNGNGSWRDSLYSWLRLLGTLSAILFAIIQVKVAPVERDLASLQKQVEAIDADRKKADEVLWKALKEHEDKPGHEGIASKVAGLEREVVGTSRELIDAREAAMNRDIDRKRELDHVWLELQDMRATCTNGRKP